MSCYKLGEEGRVPLAGLTLEGKRWADLRQALHRLERAGANVDIIPGDGISGILAELRRVSDDWLASKHTREKRFSLGAFQPDYLSRNPMAVVRVDGVIVAFASLWTGESREEFSVDLMRYHQQAPKGVMDFLFARLLLWGRDHGYRFFNLGMAPLAGMEDHKLAPVWHRLAELVFERGSWFYNFQGLYDYKEKFAPEPEPRYVAVQSPRHLPGAVAAVASLVSGGIGGVVGR